MKKIKIIEGMDLMRDDIRSAFEGITISELITAMTIRLCL